MKKIGKTAYRLSPAGSFKRVLELWEPRNPKDRRKAPSTEKQYEKSLLEHLEVVLPEIQAIPQGGRGMLRGDIVLERPGIVSQQISDVVELKLGMSSTSAFQRLVGQIETYAKGRGWTFVVICGKKVDRKFMVELKTKYESRPRVAIFHKPSKTPGVDVVSPQGL